MSERIITKAGWGELSIQEAEPSVPDPEAKVIVHAGRGNIFVRSEAEWREEQEEQAKRMSEIDERRRAEARQKKARRRSR